MLFLISFHTSAQAQLPKTTSWYVSNSGNDSNIGDKSNPLRFISTAIGKVQTGDSIIVMPGTYSENLNFNDKVFILISSSGADSTLLTSSISDNTIRVGNVSTPDTVSYLREITGFTITNRLANAVYTEGNTKLRFRNCIFKNNVGAIHNNAVTTFENCLFLNNDWAVCLQDGNSGRDLANFSGDEVFFNCIFYHNGTINTCSSLGGWKPKFINSILIENSRFGSTYSNTNLGPGYEVYNSIIDDSLYSGINSNLNINPGFINVNGNDFRLTKSSPALGNGVKEIVINGKTYKAPLFDFVGISRPNPVGSKPDLGAYENASAYPIPNLLLAEGGNKKVKLSWSQTPVSGLKSFKIFRSTTSIPDNASSGVIVDTIKVTSTSYVDSIGLTNLTKYYYRMKSVDSAGIESGMSDEVSVRPNIPPAVVTNFKAAGGPSKIYLQWDASIKPGISYNIFRSLDSVFTNSILIIKNTLGSSYYDTSVAKKGVNYFYWIKAVDSVGAVSDISAVKYAKLIPILYAISECLPEKTRYVDYNNDSVSYDFLLCRKYPRAIYYD